MFLTFDNKGINITKKKGLSRRAKIIFFILQG